MRVLLTGGTGMVGRNLLESQLLITSNIQLIAPSRNELDLLCSNSVRAYFRKHDFDAVIHAAGKVGGIQANMADPVGFLYNNSIMGFNLVKTAYDAGIKTLLNLGSSCMYPREAQNPLLEESILTGGFEPTNEGYAIAKVATAKLCEYISSVNGQFKYKTLIPCNLYGAYDKFDSNNSHMIPGVIRRLYNAAREGDVSVDIWGDGKARREFMYVEDLVECVHAALSDFERLPLLSNVGLGRDYSVNEYYACIAKVVGYEGRFNHDLSKPVGMRRKLVDSGKINEFGWRARWSLDDGVARTFQYFKSLESL